MATFSPYDIEQAGALVGAAWAAGAARDWSIPAGTLTWTCARTAAHAVDAALAPAFFLASRRQDDYSGWGVAAPGPDAPPLLLAEAITTVGRIVAAVVAAAPPDATAVIWRRPRVETRPAADFAPRSGLELLLHGHDVCAGLGIVLEPPADLCARLRDHTRAWPHWETPGWHRLAATDDPWGDLLAGSGRARS